MNKLYKTILVGLFIYLGIVLFFAVINSSFGTVQFSGATSNVPPPTFWDCVYYSCVTFGTIGYGDILPTNAFGKFLVIAQSISSIIFVGIFGGYIAYQFLKRPKNIFLTDSIFIRHINENIFFSARVGNRGNDLINCRAYIEVIQIRKNIKWTVCKKELNYTLLEYSWFTDIRLTNTEHPDFLNSLKSFFRNPSNSMIRILVIGSDIETGEAVAVSRYYKASEVKFGGGYLDIYSWIGLNKTKPNWGNLNKTAAISDEQTLEINKLLEIGGNADMNSSFASCSSG
jgi:hypothetical protein